ncbi:MAG: hypothetical protein FJ290_10905 [Planctomycetes bacterium]|nr:hypothetical protein [Planctomycetota bacterium]
MSFYNDTVLRFFQQGIHAREPWILLMGILALWLAEALAARFAGRASVAFRIIELLFLSYYVVFLGMCSTSPVWALPLVGVFVYNLLKGRWWCASIGPWALLGAVAAAFAFGLLLSLTGGWVLGRVALWAAFLLVLALACFPAVRAALGKGRTRWGSGRPGASEGEVAPGGMLAPYVETTSRYLVVEPRARLFYRGVRWLVPAPGVGGAVRWVVGLGVAAGLVVVLWATRDWGFWRAVEVRMYCLWPVVRFPVGPVLALAVFLVLWLVLTRGRGGRRLRLLGAVACLAVAVLAAGWFMGRALSLRDLSMVAGSPYLAALLVPVGAAVLVAGAMLGLRPLGFGRRAGTPDSPFFLKCLQRERAMALERYHRERYGGSLESFLGGATEAIDRAEEAPEGARKAADRLAEGLIRRFAPSGRGQDRHLERYIALSEAEFEYHRFDGGAGGRSSSLAAADASDLIASVYQEASVESEALKNNLELFCRPTGGLQVAIERQRERAARHVRHAIECREAFLGLAGGQEAMAKANAALALMQDGARPLDERLAASRLLCSYAQKQGLEADPYAPAGDVQNLCRVHWSSFERVWHLAGTAGSARALQDGQGQLEAAVASYLGYLLTLQPTLDVVRFAEETFHRFTRISHSVSLPERLKRLTGDVRLRAARGLNGIGVADANSVRRINELYAQKCYQWWTLYALLLLNKAYCP